MAVLKTLAFVVGVLLVNVTTCDQDLISDACERGTTNGSKKKPHIVMILADDLGFNDVPWHNEQVVAPHLQKLAEEGTILEQAYVQPICSPTRSALLTGRYPFTMGRQSSVIWPLTPTGLTLNVSLMSDYLKDLGYETHAVGKWHIGFCNEKFTPTQRGFDTFHGYYTGSEDYYKHTRKGNYNFSNQQNSTNIIATNDTIPYGYDFRKNKQVDLSASETYSTYLFASYVENLFKSSSPDKAKFLYMAFQSVHSPLQVPDNYTEPYKYIENTKRRKYLGMVTAMDEAVGRIVSAMKETGHYDNSVIVFSTDNGGPNISGGNNWPLRGNKSTIWEGGTRGAAFVHSPLLPKNQTGKRSTQLIHVTDWLPTFVSLGGGRPPHGIDGVDQWKTLTGQQESPRQQMVYSLDPNKHTGIRVGDYKLLVGDPGAGEWIPPPEMNDTVQVLSVKRSEEDRLKFEKEIASWTKRNHLAFLEKLKAKCSTPKCFHLNAAKYVEALRRVDLQRFRQKLLEIIYAKLSSSFNGNATIELEERKLQTKSLVHLRKLKRFWRTQNQSTDILSKLGFSKQNKVLRLFNIKDDPEERTNLAVQKPLVVLQLLKELLPHWENFVPPDTPAEDPAGDPVYWGNVWSPGWC